MKNIPLLQLSLFLIVLNTLIPASALADRDNRRTSNSHRGFNYQRSKHSKNDFRFDHRYRNNRNYPRNGFSTNRLPLRRAPIRFKNSNYFFQRGTWYRPSGSRYTVVIPPIGIAVPTLPPFYSTLWVGNIPYYYANNIYYTWRANRNSYVVTEAPDNIIEQEPELVADELFIYPRNGQNEQQQADDRYNCHRWGVTQTHYDPTQQLENISISDLSRKREGYQRAMRACLEGKNYSVR